MNRLLVAAILFISVQAQAQNMLPNLPLFGSEPQFMNIDAVVLDRGCLMMPGTDLGLACNASLLADSEITQWRFDVYGDQNIGQVWDQYQFVSHKDSFGLFRNVVEHDEAKISRASFNMWYQQENWALTFTPARVRYSVMSQNPAYLSIATYIRKDMEVAFLGGWRVEAEPRLRVGLGLRYQWSQLINQQFAVLAVGSNPEIIRVGNHRGLLIEPNMAYEFEESYHTNFIIAATGLEVFQDGLKEGNADPLADVGLTIRPEWDGWHWTLGSQMTFLGDMPLSRRFKFTSLLECEWANFTSMIGVGQFGIGMSTAIDSLTLGIGYVNKTLSNSSDWGEPTVQELLLDFGLRF